MASIRAADTEPEVYVRRVLHAGGFRFRLRPRSLPGRPDLVLPRYRLAVFVHGCFWHRHDCTNVRVPRTNTAYWRAKLDANADRDRRNEALLAQAGWAVRIVWQCRLAADTATLLADLRVLRERTRT